MRIYFHSIPGIPSSLPILKPGDPVPKAGPWSKYIERLPWSVAKEGELFKSVFLKFLIGQDKKREPVVRPTMGFQPERWNEDLGSNIQNVEAVLIQTVGREVSVRCDYCLAGRGIFALCRCALTLRNCSSSASSASLRRYTFRSILAIMLSSSPKTRRFFAGIFSSCGFFSMFLFRVLVGRFDTPPVLVSNSQRSVRFGHKQLVQYDCPGTKTHEVNFPSRFLQLVQA